MWIEETLYHKDRSDVTIDLCLGKFFKGGSINFQVDEFNAEVMKVLKKKLMIEQSNF